MAPVGKLRRVLGVVKDQASISLAKVASSRASDLDVTLVKATSHDDAPTNEKYVHKIFHFMSGYRGYVSACVDSLAKRLSKTRDWIVALKVLILTHRLLRDGSPAFAEELMFVSRRMLNVSSFRDDSHSHAWDYSAFVHTYGMYLNKRLDCFASIYELSNQKTNTNDFRTDYHHDGGFDYGDDSRRGLQRRKQEDENMLVKEMNPDLQLLEKLPVLQHLLDHVLVCRSTGTARQHRLVQIALNLIVRDSFHVYTDICEGITVLLEGYFSMEHQDCVKAFDIFSKAAKQAEELSSFYNMAKSSGICRPSEYPTVQKVLQDHLNALEDYLQDRCRPSHLRRSKTPEPPPQITVVEPDAAMEITDAEDFNSIKTPPESVINNTEKQQPNGDLISLDQAKISSGEHEKKLALAQFSSAFSAIGNGRWETFGASTQGHNGHESGKEGWELALMNEASKLSQNETSMAGGFDRLLLDSMYDQITCQNISSTVAAGSASSVALPRRAPSSIFALPAPVALSSENPFAASAIVPPPSIVQMEDLRQKQQLLLQEQQLWQQYQRQGMQGSNVLINIYNPFIPPQSSSSLPFY